MLMAAIPQASERTGIFKIYLEIVANQKIAPEYLKMRAQELINQACSVVQQGSTTQDLSKEALFLAIIIRSNRDIAEKLGEIHSIDELSQQDAGQILQKMEPKFAGFF